MKTQKEKPFVQKIETRPIWEVTRNSCIFVLGVTLEFTLHSEPEVEDFYSGGKGKEMVTEE